MEDAEVQEDDKESEQSADEGDEFERKPEYTGKDRKINWSVYCPPCNKCTSDINLVWHLPGVKTMNEINSEL